MSPSEGFPRAGNEKSVNKQQIATDRLVWLFTLSKSNINPGNQPADFAQYEAELGL